MKLLKNVQFLIVFALLFTFCSKTPKVMLPGKLSDGSILLPNRYKLTPAGEQIPVGDLPLNMVLSPDGKFIAVTNNGYSDQFVSIIDVASQKQVQTLPVRASFFGIDFSADGSKLFISGGAKNLIYIFARKKSQLVRTDSISLADPRTEWFVTGLQSAQNGKVLYAATKTLKTLLKISVSKKKIVQRLTFDHFLYDVLLNKSGDKLYVSIWGGSAVAVVDPINLSLLKTIAVGAHPNKMILAQDGRLFVANANTDNVTVIDTKNNDVVETISVKPFAQAPNGSTPNGLAVSADNKTLYVANANNNCVAVVDISQSGSSRVSGFIPTGWYPTAATLTKDGGQLFIANGKGLISKANPNGPDPTKKRDFDKNQYIARLLWGTVSVLQVPKMNQLEQYTAQVYKNNDWNKLKNLTSKDISRQVHAIPRTTGESSYIRHVLYIIKENRTYDQIFGDLPQGNGDSSIVLFGRNITPNHHKIVEEFTLFDNFYVDAEVSADGHEWSMGAIATDFIEKTWPSVYSGRGKGYPSEGKYEIAFPSIGYIWDMAARKGISYRSYAEFINAVPDTAKPAVTRMKTLKGHYDTKFRPWDLDYPDVLRAKEFIRELHQFEKTGDLPNLMIMRLPNDHTYGTRAGKHTPRSMVADNDLAVGMVFDALSHSKFWKETAIFVLEDDAQNGPDHVDAHRSVLLVASPYTRRGYVDHNMYDTASVLKTIELILGLPPMSQYDAAAFPLIPAFQDKPDFTPFVHLPNSYPMDKINSKLAYGAELSLAMNFSEEDETPEQELNEILWKAVKGVHSKMPAIRNARYRQLFD
ncbi:MAG: bifunctional YncE family protein/alkaline phosphatase family protein [Calditrichaeota bacterium]|nr:bifunctional YncE family protein/alkaline phosphatase family protein [Calditrichota bacterium]